MKVPIVFSNGSGRMKAGFAGEDAPRTIFPSVVGHVRHQGVKMAKGRKDSYVGNEAQSLRGVLTLRSPIQHGIVENWDNMEKIWEHTFRNELGVAPEEHPVHTTEAPFNPKANREKAMQIMFETFNCAAFFLSMDAFLALYATGCSTGVVVSSGSGVSHITPFYEGNLIPHAVIRMPLSGDELRENMRKSLYEGGQAFSTTGESEIVDDIKEKLCYVALDFEKEHQKATPGTLYQLPDGNTISVGDIRYRVPEFLFQPSLLDLDEDGLHRNLFTAISKCQLDQRTDLYSNIVMDGGNTMYPGFAQRFQKEIMSLAPSSTKVNVIAPLNRQYLAWSGGSMFSRTSTFLNQLITKEEYEECGYDIVHRRKQTWA